MARRIGIPIGLVFDNAKEQLKGLFRKKCCDMGIDRRPIESYSPWMNGAEDAICELKHGSSWKLRAGLLSAQASGIVERSLWYDTA